MAPRSRNSSSLSRAALLTFFVAIFCIVVAHGRRRRRAAENGDGDEIEILPPVRPLPERRKRSLTPSLPETGAAIFSRGRKNPRLRARSQGQSLLFAKLPFEIRAMVWRAAVAGEVLHIVGRVDTVGGRGNKDGTSDEYLRLSHLKCSAKSHPVCSRRMNYGTTCCDCCGLEEDRQRRRRRREKGVGREMVRVLLLCQRIYAEAIDIVYQGNTFEFHCADKLLPFSTTILPQRLDAMRKLRLHQSFGFDLINQTRSSPARRGTKAHAGWWRLWRLVANMNGLRDLKVALVLPFNQWLPIGLEQETTLLEPLLLVTRPRRFTVYVTWSRPPPVVETEDMPFDVVQCDLHDARNLTIQ